MGTVHNDGCNDDESPQIQKIVTVATCSSQKCNGHHHTDSTITCIIIIAVMFHTVNRAEGRTQQLCFSASQMLQYMTTQEQY